MSELLSAVFSFSQFKTAWDWIGLIADIFGFVALGITIWQIVQVNGKINSSIDAMNELKRLQEQELLKKIFVDLSDQQGALCWLLEKNGQNGYRIGTLQEKNSEIIFRVNHCINELPAKYKEIVDPLRSVVLELRNYNGKCRKPLEEAEGYLYSALLALKLVEEKYALDNINMIAHSD